MLNQVAVTDVAVNQADIDAGKFFGDTGTGGIGEVRNKKFNSGESPNVMGGFPCTLNVLSFYAYSIIHFSKSYIYIYLLYLHLGT